MIFSLLLFMLGLIVILGYTEKGKNALLAPQYGGIPVELNQMLVEAKRDKDTDVQSEVHKLRKKYFRNRRTAEEQSVVEKEAQAKFIKKYGDAGIAAIKHDETKRKLALLTPEENAALVKELTQPPAPPKVQK